MANRRAIRWQMTLYVQNVNPQHLLNEKPKLLSGLIATTAIIGSIMRALDLGEKCQHLLFAIHAVEHRLRSYDIMNSYDVMNSVMNSFFHIRSIDIMMSLI